jgi:hypothetical protein
MSEFDAKQAVIIARSVLAGSLPLLLGCRRILGPLERLKVEMDPQFRLFVGIDSETDHLPIDPAERKLWNSEALVEKDREIERATAWAEKLRPRAAFEAVIRRFDEGG